MEQAPTDSESDLDTNDENDTGIDSESDTGSETDEDTDTDFIPDPCIFRVDASSGIGGNGLTWENALNTISQGLDWVEYALSEAETCQIWVAAGTYYIREYSSEDTVALRPNLELYGGFAGDETSLEQRDPEVNETILDGHGDEIWNEWVYHVVTGADDALIDGFTITGGWANGSDLDSRGGGMINDSVSPTVINCRFENNHACHSAGCAGGGMYNRYASPEIIDCEFIDNTAESGGGIANYESSPVVENCLFEYNATPNNSGGAVYNASGEPTFDECIFEYNTASFTGGAVAIYGSVVTFLNCEFEGNSTETYGGGAMFSWELSEVTVDGGMFIDNTAATNGGAIAAFNSEVTLSGITFSGNEASTFGGSIHLFDTVASIEDCWFASNNALHCGALNAAGAEVIVTNSVLTANRAESGVGGAICSGTQSAYGTELEAINCTFYQNSIGSDVESMGVSIAAGIESSATAVNCIFSETVPVEINGDLATAQYSLISSTLGGDGNIDADPLFVDADSGDFHLQPGSPCIDAANGDVAPEFDIDGNERVDDAATANTGVGTPNYVDMGAFEYQP